MAEPATTTTVTVATLSCVVGTSACTVLAAFGIDVASMVAALMGCLVVQTLLPAEQISLRSIALTTLGSMIFASVAAPWLVPYVAKITPEGMAYDHVRASTAALLAAFPKPLLLLIKNRYLKAVGGQDA